VELHAILGMWGAVCCIDINKIQVKVLQIRKGYRDSEQRKIRQQEQRE
jgi:hypothetical protein